VWGGGVCGGWEWCGENTANDEQLVCDVKLGTCSGWSCVGLG